MSAWIGLEPSDMPDGENPMYDHPFFIEGMVWANNKLLEKNTAPSQRQPLTEGEIVACIDDVFAWALDDGNIDDSHVIRFTRAIERAHGIGDKHD